MHYVKCVSSIFIHCNSRAKLKLKFASFFENNNTKNKGNFIFLSTKGEGSATIY